jgi:hypothetical protein
MATAEGVLPVGAMPRGVSAPVAGSIVKLVTSLEPAAAAYAKRGTVVVGLSPGTMVTSDGSPRTSFEASGVSAPVAASIEYVTTSAESLAETKAKAPVGSSSMRVGAVPAEYVPTLLNSIVVEST